MRKQFEIGFSCESSLRFIGEDTQKSRTSGTVSASRRQKSQNRPQAMTVFLTMLESRAVR